jgi:hypothetical protein
MVEKAQRPALKKETLRELYLKSGNWCAFPNCKKRLFNIKGTHGRYGRTFPSSVRSAPLIFPYW